MTGSLHVGLAALGAALGVGLIGMKASDAVGRNPGAATHEHGQPNHRNHSFGYYRRYWTFSV